MKPCFPVSFSVCSVSMWRSRLRKTSFCLTLMPDTPGAGKKSYDQKIWLRRERLPDSWTGDAHKLSLHHPCCNCHGRGHHPVVVFARKYGEVQKLLHPMWDVFLVISLLRFSVPFSCWLWSWDLSKAIPRVICLLLLNLNRVLCTVQALRITMRTACFPKCFVHAKFNFQVTHGSNFSCRALSKYLAFCHQNNFRYSLPQVLFQRCRLPVVSFSKKCAT